MVASARISTRRPLLHWSAGDRAIVAIGTAAVVVSLVGFFALARAMGPDLWVPLVLILLFTCISVPLCSRLAGRPMDRRLRRILLVAFALKLLCTGPRYLMNEVAYEGHADAALYHDAGRSLRENVSQGRWTIEGTALDSYADETRFVGYVAGGLYLVTGASQMGGYLVFSWLCWLGLAAVFRAFRIAYPDAPPYLAAGLIFFLPSTLYWPSSIGKDALMVLGLGLVSLGLARVMMASRPLLGLGWLVLGSSLVVAVRAHLLLIVLVGVAVSLIARRAAGARSRGAIVGRCLLLAALVPALFIGLGRMDAMFGTTVDGGSVSVSEVLDRTGARTSVGGSSFETQPVTSPVGVPVAAVNVLFRPFLFEARNAASLVTALEGTALLGLTVVALRWLWRAGPAMYRHPFAAFCGGYVLAFVFAFSHVGNSGILARQRVQMFPILMVLVAAAAEHRRLHASVSPAEPSATDLPSPSSLARLVPTS
ncbi:MAG: hypothetical protein JWM47_945 [Acidimicrobiales bacterium]|nr:hypothetical protein [Acidimicrobiales bacterium]